MSAFGINYTSGCSLYAVFRDNDGRAWNGSAFVIQNNANWAAYAVAMPETPVNGCWYQATVPAFPAGSYSGAVHRRDGAAAVPADSVAATIIPFDWDGSGRVTVASRMAATQALQVQPIAATIPANKIDRVGDTLAIYRNSPLKALVAVFDASSNAVNLSGRSLVYTSAPCDGSTGYTITTNGTVGERLTIGGASNNQVSIEAPATKHPKATVGDWSLRDALTKELLAWGDYEVFNVPGAA